MDYRGTLILRERLRKNWSQEGLCRGICAVSYLSKIEKGRAEPSEDILRRLLERLGLHTDRALEEKAAALAALAWETLLYEGEDRMYGVLGGNIQPFYPTAAGLDLQLLARFGPDERLPLDSQLESCMMPRQLALQRILQERYDEAVGLLPCGLTYLTAGVAAYDRGEYLSAAELLQTAYELAAREGAPRLMMLIQAYLGNICNNCGDPAGMEKHYAVTSRIAKALNEPQMVKQLDYNRGALAIEMGRFEEAYTYFSALSEPGLLELHKLAIASERTGRRGEALRALERAEGLDCWLPDDLGRQLCELVRFRLEHEGYLENAEYGRLLQLCFERCRRELPAGFAAFHLPWMLEWLTATRQYKQAYELMRDFSANRG